MQFFDIRMVFNSHICYFGLIFESAQLPLHEHHEDRSENFSFSSYESRLILLVLTGK